MASAADLNFVSASSSSSDLVSRRCIASMAPRCSMRICRCLAIAAPVYAEDRGSDPGGLLGVAVRRLARGLLPKRLPSTPLAGGLRAGIRHRRGQLDLLPAAQARRGRALGGA